jgi:monothiol glutaredoxin
MMSQALKQEIEQEIAGSPVHLYIKGTPEIPQCGFSKAVCEAFMFLDVPFTTTNVLLDLDNYRSALHEVSQWPTIPQVFVGGEFIGGCDIVLEMMRSGDLQKMVEGIAGSAVQ